MGRPSDPGIPYFPLNVDFRDDDKVALVLGENKEKGFEILITLLCKIYKERYYYSWTEKEEILFSNKYGFDISSVRNVVSSALKWGFFHQKLEKSYQILTSNGIQKRWLVATKKRVNSIMYTEFCLVEHPEELNSKIKIVSGGINDVSSGRNEEKVGRNPQSKVKYSKVNSLTTSDPDGSVCEHPVENSDHLEQCPEQFKTAQSLLREIFNYELKQSDLPILKCLFDKNYPSTVYEQLRKVKSECEKKKRSPPKSPINYIYAYMKDWDKTWTKKQQEMQSDDEAYFAAQGLQGSDATQVTMIRSEENYEEIDKMFQEQLDPRLRRRQDV